MLSVPVRLKERSYKIVIGKGIFSKAGALLRSLDIGRDAVIITNPLILKLHGRALVRELQKQGFSAKVFTVADGEQSKSPAAVFDLWNKIARYDVNKKLFIIALGGGVVGDLAGYAAASYKRGIPYIQIPTTFLAQIDSAIGGKTGIDLAAGKNLVGAFYQPKLVLSDTGVLATLSLRQIRNGLAEAVKYGVIADAGLFRYIERNYRKLLARDPKVLAKVVIGCSRIKAGVVSRDEKETRGLRTILNFGHTVGHAVEAAGGYRHYHHGEAVALGMRAAGDISCRLGFFSLKDLHRLEELLSKIGLPRAFMARGRPKKTKRPRLSQILEKMRHDKKFKAGKNCFVLAKGIGRVVVQEEIPLSVIEDAVTSLLST